MVLTAAGGVPGRAAAVSPVGVSFALMAAVVAVALFRPRSAVDNGVVLMSSIVVLQLGRLVRTRYFADIAATVAVLVAVAWR